jgi:hypothetical protein
MLQPTIAPIKKNSAAIAAAALQQPVMNNSNTYQAKKVANTYGNTPISTASYTVDSTEKSIRYASERSGKINISGIIGWINPEYNEDSPLFNPDKTLQDWLMCPEHIDINSVNNVSVNVEKSNNNNPSVSRKARVIVNNADMTELAEISLGYFRNIYMKHPSYNVTLFGRRVETPSPDGKIIYTTVISAKNADVDIATKLIKEIAMGTKTVIDWL